MILRIALVTGLLLLANAAWSQITLTFQQTTAAPAAPAGKPFQLGEILELESAVLSEKRTLNVYLPDGYYSETGTRYPVIYALDGSANEDFIHLVGLVQFFVNQYNMPKAIVVGIANVDRKRDFTFPTTIKADKEAYPTTGESARFITFLEQEVQPLIRNTYRTVENRMLIGQSLGGLLATEVLLKKPELFERYCIVSPSLWWDGESLLQQAPALLSQQRKEPAHVCVAVGEEGKVMVHDAKTLGKLLLKSGIRTDFIYLPKENHATALHASVYEAFRKFFPAKG
jgi:uncharacterized protein